MGSLNRFRIGDVAGESEPAPTRNPSQAGWNSGAHVAGDAQEEANGFLGQGGIHGMKVEHGITPKPVPPVVSTKPATPDSTEYTLLLRNVKAKILLRDEDWTQRLEALLRDVQLIKVDLEIPPNLELHGRFCAGWRVSDTSTLQVGIFSCPKDLKTRLYLNWFEDYEKLEKASIQKNPTEGLLSSLRMSYNAVALYLLETGAVAQGDPAPEFDRAVVNEITARLRFLCDKDGEYGQPTRRHGIPGVLSRVFDKVSRYTNLKASPNIQPKFESMLDSLKDMGGYSLILAGLFQEVIEAQDPTNEWCWKTTQEIK